MSPDARQHRGPHPSDKQLFAERQLPALREAVVDLSTLLGRDYSPRSSLKLVGDRYSLRERQRLAVARASCSDAQRQHRRVTCIPVESLPGNAVAIDGFNLLITIEAAMSGGVLVLCRDECIRDLSGVHGSYRSVDETDRAILLIGEALEANGAGHAVWFFDRPVSNSGRLAQRIRGLADNRGWSWEVDVVFNPDAALIDSKRLVISSDSTILDLTERWLNLAPKLIAQLPNQAWIVDLRSPEETSTGDG